MQAWCFLRSRVARIYLGLSIRWHRYKTALILHNFSPVGCAAAEEYFCSFCHLSLITSASSLVCCLWSELILSKQSLLNTFAMSILTNAAYATSLYMYMISCNSDGVKRNICLSKTLERNCSLLTVVHWKGQIWSLFHAMELTRRSNCIELEADDMGFILCFYCQAITSMNCYVFPSTEHLSHFLSLSPPPPPLS